MSGLLDAAVAVLSPPPAPMSVYEFASTITLVGGPLSGQRLNPKAERAIDLWLQELASHRHRWHLLIAPSQRGKTLCGVLIPTLHALIERRVNAGWVMPSLDKLGQKWTGDLLPTLESGGFTRYFPKHGPASKGGRPAALRIQDPVTTTRLATFYAMALGKGGSETSTASNPCAFLAIDEADDAESAGQIALTKKRTASYGSAGGGTVASTINERRGRDLHPALELYADTTQTRLAHHCPHCHEFVILGIEHFNVASSALVCPSCAVLWSEADRHKARNEAEYRHGNPDAEDFGILYVAADYFWEYPDPATGKCERMLVGLAREHQSAWAAKERGDVSQWNTYLRKQWCMPESADDSEVPHTVDLEQAARATKSPHLRGEIPTGVSVITCGCDVGKRDGWHLTLGMRPDLSWYALDWGHRHTGDPKAEPTPHEQRDVLTALRVRIGRIGKCHDIGVDAGYNTDLVTKWARSNGILLMRGDQRPTGKKDDDRNKRLPSWAEDRRQDDGSHWLFIDGGAVKTEIAKALAREPGAPGAGHIPREQEAGDWLIRHLCAEVWDAKHSVWVRRAGRDNHLLDCLVYAWALAMIRMLRPVPVDIPPPFDKSDGDYHAAVW